MGSDALPSILAPNMAARVETVEEQHRQGVVNANQVREQRKSQKREDRGTLSLMGRKREGWRQQG